MPRSREISQRIIFCSFAFVCFAFHNVAAAEQGDTATAEKNATEVLKAQGLRRAGSNYVLETEIDLTKRLSAIRKLKKAVRKSSKGEAAVEQIVANKEKLIADYLVQRRRLRAQIPNARSPEQHNRIVNAINELADRIMLLNQEKETDKRAKQARGQSNTAKEAYIQHLLDMRSLADATVEKYADLSVNKNVTDAIKEVSEAKGKEYKLGPGRGLTRVLSQLKKLEDTVLSEKIQLRHDGSLFNISVVFNGKYAKEMALDTGASLVCLPHQMATDVGITPTANDPIVRLQLADGKIVNAKLVTIDELRVGKFMVKDVKCAVMGPDLPAASPLLGQSFLRHFSYKMDSENATLTMTKIETPGKKK